MFPIIPLLRESMGNRTLIIAEAGVNHNGDPGLAKELVDVAAEAGADLVKFQTFNTRSLVTTSRQLRPNTNYTTIKLRSANPLCCRPWN